MTMAATTVDTRLFRVFIRATPQQIWDALSDMKTLLETGDTLPA
jgi:hypothetical protein